LYYVIKDREQEFITERKKKLKMIDEVDLNRVNSGYKMFEEYTFSFSLDQIANSHIFENKQKIH